MNNNHVEGIRKKNVRPWDLPQPKGSLASTIFVQEFLTCVIDESHHMRNPGRKHSAALRLLQQATVRVIMTATPLHTSSKVSLGHNVVDVLTNCFTFRTSRLWRASSESPTSQLRQHT